MDIVYSQPMEEDIRWKQRLSNYRKAMNRLGAAVRLAAERPLSDLENQGLIQAFKFTHELAWNLMKDWLENRISEAILDRYWPLFAAFQEGMSVKESAA